MNGLRFKKENDWTKDNIDDELSENWIGKTIFIVDKQHSPDHAVIFCVLGGCTKAGART